MIQQKKVRAEAILDVEVGRELMEDELAAICGGSASASTPSDANQGNTPGLSDLTNLLSPQGASSKNGAGSFPGLSGLAPLSSLTSGLLGQMI